MVTNVGLAKFWMTLFDWPIIKTRSFLKILGLILNASWVIVIFARKFQNLRYHGNRGWSDTNFSHTIKSADPEKTPDWRKNLHGISYTSCVIADFLIKFTNFCYHGNKGIAKIWMTSFDRPTSKTPSLVQKFRTYPKRELSYCDFCVQISKFSLPWQQGLVLHKFHSHS